MDTFFLIPAAADHLISASFAASGVMGERFRQPGKKEAVRMMRTVRPPVIAQDFQRILRKNRITIFIPFAAPNEHAHLFRVNILYPQRADFRHPQTGTISQRDHSFMLQILADSQYQ